MRYTPRTEYNQWLYQMKVIETMADESAASAAWDAWLRAIERQLHGDDVAGDTLH